MRFFKKKKIHWFLLSFLLIIPWAIFISFSQLKYSHNYPIPAHLQVSLDPKKRNVISLFIDGLDDDFYKVVARVNKNKDFEDFVGFNKFMASGFKTRMNVPYLSGGFSEATDYMHLYKKKYKGYVKLYEALDKTIMNEATLNYIHKIDDKNEKVQRALLNLVNLTDEPYKAYTGKPQWIKSTNDRLFPNKNVELINLNMAKQKISNNGWKATNYSPSGAYFKWLNTHLKSSPLNTPLNLLVSDMTLHDDYYDKDGTYKMVITNNADNAYNSLVVYLANFFKVLKLIKNDQTNAFDNSMIIIYGDHASHKRFAYDVRKSIKEQTNGFQTNLSSKNHPLLLVKYPDQKNDWSKNKIKQVNDVTIHVSQLTRFIDYFYKNNLNQESKAIEDFIAENKDTNFKVDRELPVFEKDKYYLAKFAMSGAIIPTTDWNLVKNADLNHEDRRLLWK